MNLPFADLDMYIEHNTGRTISEMFESNGESFFRDVESEYLKNLIKNSEPLIIALGGGTVCFNENLKTIKTTGLLVYIQMPAKVLTDRLKESKEQRPLTANKNDIELLSYINLTLDKRKAFYEQAHITVNGLNLTAQALHQKLVEFH